MSMIEIPETMKPETKKLAMILSIVIGIVGVILIAYGIYYYYYVLPGLVLTYTLCVLSGNHSCTAPNTNLQYEVIISGIIIVLIGIGLFFHFRSE